MKLITFLVLIAVICGHVLASDLIHEEHTLSQPRFGLAATTVDNKAIFAGGNTVGGIMSNVVDIYDASLGSPTDPLAWSTARLSQAREWLCAVNVCNKAIFAGGRLYGGGVSNRVDIYDADSGTWSTASLSQPRFALAATAIGNYAIFAGGRSGSTSYNTVDIYNASTGTWSTFTLSQARSWLSGITVDNKAVFAGGYGPYSKVVDIYDAALGDPIEATAWYTSELSQARNGMAATSLCNKGFFAGGASPSNSNLVDIYNASTSTWTTSNLSQARYNLAATTLGNLILFGGGNNSSSTYFDLIDIHDCSSDNWTIDTLSQARCNLAATTVNTIALFAGGQYNGNYSNIVDIYKLSPIQIAIDIKPGSCPNPINVNNKGVLPAAILGTEDFEVFKIDPASIRLAGVAPIRSSYEDVATPVAEDAEDCECTTSGPDGYLDLTLKFNTQEIVAALGGVNDGDELELTLTGELSDETKIQGKDCIVILKKGKEK